MDNSTTTWIMVALLLLLIGAAIFMLLRRPGGDGGTAVDNRDVTGVDAPGAAGNAGTDVLAEGRDLGPGSAAPEMDSLRARADEPFDQHAADERRYDGVATDEPRVTDEPAVTDEPQVTDDDQGLWREAAAVGAAGAAGGGAVAGTRAEEPVTTPGTEPQETEYVVREDDHEPVPFTGSDDDDVEPVEDAYPAPSESTSAAPVEAPAYAEPVEESTDRAPAESRTWDDTFVTEPSDGEQVRTDEVGAGQADVHPLSTDEIDAGARQEPLPADEQTPLEPEDVSGAEASDHRDEVREDDYSDTDRQGWRDAAAIGAAGAAGAGTAAGATAPVDQDEGHGYHDDTTLVRENEPDGIAAGETSTTDFEAATTAGGVTHAEGRGGATAADYQQGDLLDQPQTDGGIEDRGAGSTYAEPGTDATLEDTTGRTGPGDTATTGDTGGAIFAESAYGPGSAEPGEDGTGPTGWQIKGNSGSMLFHTPESPSYDAVRAEVWFESEETARAAGFAHWDRRRR